MDYYLIHMYEMSINAVAVAAISTIYCIALLQHWDQSHINNLLYAFVTLFGFAHQRITHTRYRLIPRPARIFYFALPKSNTFWTDTNCDSFEPHVVRCCYLLVLTFNLFTWYKNQRRKRVNEREWEGNKVNNEWTHFSTSFNSATQTAVAPLFTRSLKVNFCIDICIICIK